MKNTLICLLAVGIGYLGMANVIPKGLPDTAPQAQTAQTQPQSRQSPTVVVQTIKVAKLPPSTRKLAREWRVLEKKLRKELSTRRSQQKDDRLERDAERRAYQARIANLEIQLGAGLKREGKKDDEITDLRIAESVAHERGVEEGTTLVQGVTLAHGLFLLTAGIFLGLLFAWPARRKAQKTSVRG